MRSGNGRHRRPRQAPTVLVTAGVTGAGLALPLLGASGASAVDASTWDQVAECESGGLWSANEQNGYYGGLQLTQQMWDENGGRDYAERPDLASRGQQITVAEQILDVQGADAFPACAASAGLDEEDGGTDPLVDAGDLLSPAPEQPEPSESEPSESAPADSEPADPGATEPEAAESEPAESGGADGGADGADTGDGADGAQDGTVAPEPTPTPSDDEGADADDSRDEGAPADPAPGTTPGTGKHRGDEADETGKGEEAGEADGAQDGDHPSRGGKHARPDAGHLVHSGDSLSRIAAEHDVEGGWPGLYERNQDVVGADPDLILPGQHLTL